MEIGPGDWVECIKCNPYRGGIITGLHLGGLYQIRAINNAGSGLHLVGIKSPFELGISGNPDCAWTTEAFCPIYRPSATFIAGLKEPFKEKLNA